MSEIKNYILKLSKDNNISYYPDSLDLFAKKITELSDNKIEEDIILDLLIKLEKQNIIDKKELINLTYKYLTEKIK